MTDEGADAVENTDKVAETRATDEDTPEVLTEESTTLTLEDGGERVAETAEFVALSETAPAAPARGLLLPALIGGLLAAVLGLGFFGWKFWEQHQLNQARDDAQRAAMTYAQVLTSVDSSNVDENFKQVLDGATGEFKDMYSKSSVELRQLLIENKATAHGVVVESAVQSASKDKAVVLLFVDQSVSNTKLPDPRIDRSRMKMTLEKIDGAWRTAKVELP